MNIKVHYEEMANYVEKHYMIRPQLKRIDDKTLEVTTVPLKWTNRSLN